MGSWFVHRIHSEAKVKINEKKNFFKPKLVAKGKERRNPKRGSGRQGGRWRESWVHSLIKCVAAVRVARAALLVASVY